MILMSVEIGPNEGSSHSGAIYYLSMRRVIGQTVAMLGYDWLFFFL